MFLKGNEAKIFLHGQEIDCVSMGTQDVSTDTIAELKQQKPITFSLDVDKKGSQRLRGLILRLSSLEIWRKGD